MGFFGFGGSRDQAPADSRSDKHEQTPGPIHKDFFPLPDGIKFANKLYTEQQPDQKKDDAEERPWFTFSFTDETVHEILNGFDHPAVIEYGKDTPGEYIATVWCANDSKGEDLATMEEEVRSHGGIIKDEIPDKQAA